MTMLALIPLFSVVWMLVWRGGRKLSMAARLRSAFLKAAEVSKRDCRNALDDRLTRDQRFLRLEVLILSQASNENRLAQAVRFAAKVSTIPSILAVGSLRRHRVDDRWIFGDCRRRGVSVMLRRSSDD